MPFQYTIVTWTSCEGGNGSSKVEYYLNSGWILAGGISLCATSPDSGYTYVTTYAQALMKHTPSDSSSITTKL